MTSGRKKIEFTEGQIRRVLARLKMGDNITQIARDMRVNPRVVTDRLKEAGHDPTRTKFFLTSRNGHGPVSSKTQKPATA